MLWGCDVEEVGVVLRLDNDREGLPSQVGTGDEVVEAPGVMCKDGLGDGWEEEGTGDEKTFTCGDNCSEGFGERTEVTGDGRLGVATGVVVSAETTGIAPVFGVTSA